MQNCQGILRNGMPCTFRARYNGYCGHHRTQISTSTPRILRREYKCAFTNCLYQISRQENIFCDIHSGLELTNRCGYHDHRGNRCRTMTFLTGVYCLEHDLYDRFDEIQNHIQFMTWGYNYNSSNDYLREFPLNNSIIHDLHIISTQIPLQRAKPIIKKIVLLETDKENICSICFEKFELQKEIYELKCNHHFHINCLDQWLDEKHSCPLDRSIIE